MKIMMVEGRYTGEIDLSRINAGMLPERIGLITTVQFLDFIDDFKAFLERSKKKVFIGKERQKYNAQLLGCDQGAANSIKDDVDAYIYFGTGKFHPLGVVLATGKDVYCYDPINAIMGKVESEEAQRYNKQRKLWLNLSSKIFNIQNANKNPSGIQKHSSISRYRHNWKNIYRGHETNRGKTKLLSR